MLIHFIDFVPGLKIFIFDLYLIKSESLISLNLMLRILEFSFCIISLEAGRAILPYLVIPQVNMLLLFYDYK